MDREAWHVAVHGVTESQTRLKQLNMHALLKQTQKPTLVIHFDLLPDKIFFNSLMKSCSSQNSLYIEHIFSYNIQHSLFLMISIDGISGFAIK